MLQQYAAPLPAVLSPPHLFGVGHPCAFVPLHVTAHPCPHVILVVLATWPTPVVGEVAGLPFPFFPPFVERQWLGSQSVLSGNPVVEQFVQKLLRQELRGVCVQCQGGVAYLGKNPGER